jgi:hypothetical protein
MAGMRERGLTPTGGISYSMKAFRQTRSINSRRGLAKKHGSRILHVETLEARQMLHGSDVWFAPVAAEGEGSPIADFALDDVNATSPTGGQQVSPRDFVGQVSGWYFGSAL